MKRRCGDGKRGHLPSAGHTPQWGHLHHSVVPQYDRRSVVGTIWSAQWSPQYGPSGKGGQQTAPQRHNLQKARSHRSLHTAIERDTWEGSLAQLLSPIERNQLVKDQATSRSPNNQIPAKECTVAQSNTHLKSMMLRTDATLSQILVEPESKRMRLVRLTITFEPQ